MSISARHNRLSASGTWLSDDVAATLPPVRREFDNNRDPYIKKQIADLDKTEAERRREQEGGTQSGGSGDGDTGRGSDMVKKQKHWFIPRPPPHIREDADRAQFKTNWLLEQANAVMARAVVHSGHDRSPARDHSRAATQPSQGPTHDLDP